MSGATNGTHSAPSASEAKRSNLGTVNRYDRPSKNGGLSKEKLQRNVKFGTVKSLENGNQSEPVNNTTSSHLGPRSESSFELSRLFSPESESKVNPPGSSVGTSGGQASCAATKSAEVVSEPSLNNKSCDSKKTASSPVIGKCIQENGVRKYSLSDKQNTDSVQTSGKSSGTPTETITKSKNSMVADNCVPPQNENIKVEESTDEREDSPNTFVGFTKEMIVESPIAKCFVKHDTDESKQERKRRQREKQQAFKMKMKDKIQSGNSSGGTATGSKKTGSSSEASVWNDEDSMVGEG